MYKFFKKPRLIKCICFLLVAVFTFNVAGCGNTYNGVPSGHVENPVIGKGNNVVGYTVYSEATFDRMSKELFMGYL